MTEPARKLQKVQHDEGTGAARGRAAAALFANERDGDRASLDWLRAHIEQPRCAALLQQIMAWEGVEGRDTERALAKEHGVLLTRETRRDCGRLANISEGPSRKKKAE